MIEHFICANHCFVSWWLIILLICHNSSLENRQHQLYFQGGNYCTEKKMDLPGFTKLVRRMTDCTSRALGPRAWAFSSCFTLQTCQTLDTQTYSQVPLHVSRFMPNTLRDLGFLPTNEVSKVRPGTLASQPIPVWC